MKMDTRKPEVESPPSSRTAETRLFTFDDLMNMGAVALRAAGVTEIRPIPAAHAARHFPSFSHRDNGQQR